MRSMGSWSDACSPWPAACGCLGAGAVPDPGLQAPRKPSFARNWSRPCTQALELHSESSSHVVPPGSKTLPRGGGELLLPGTELPVVTLACPRCCGRGASWARPSSGQTGGERSLNRAQAPPPHPTPAWVGARKCKESPAPQESKDQDLNGLGESKLSGPSSLNTVQYL